jgi:cysteine desulfurase family protein (TIGR01976 family)
VADAIATLGEAHDAPAPAPNLDVAALRAEFPALALERDGRPVVYLDGPGGTQVPQRVIDAVADYYRTSNANNGGAFATSQRSDERITEAREAVADFLNAGSANEIKFGPNMTTLTFALSRAVGATLGLGDEVVVTALDHDANVTPWRLLGERGAVVRTVEVRRDDCTLDLADLDAKLTSRTRLVAVGLASNAVGSINDVAWIARRAHDAGALLFVDAVHFGPHGPIDVQALDCDLLACSAYKFFGPHLGILYGREELLDSLPTAKVRPAHDRWETGTQDHEGIVGTGAAIDYLVDVGDRYGRAEAARFAASGFAGRRLALKAGMAAIRTYEQSLLRRLMAGLARIPGVHVFGITDEAAFDRRVPTVSFTLDGRTAREVASGLGQRGVFVWDGNMYAVELTERLGVEPRGGFVRIGLVHYNTAEEVDRLLEELGTIATGGRR